MSRAVVFVVAAVCTFAVAGAAQADTGTANAATLSTEARAIYEAAAPDFAKAADPRAFIKVKTVDFVRSGAIARDSARSSTMAARNRLKKLR